MGIYFYKMIGKFKYALAAAMISDATAMQNRAEVELVSQALAMTSQQSAARAHLENALAAMTTKTDAEILESHSQLVSVPIDEKRALTLKVSPTYTYDEVNSVTLKAIRKKDRNEAKDISDYYNVTVSMMIKRRPLEVAARPVDRDPYAPEGNATLASTLDKGFPYDD